MRRLLPVLCERSDIGTPQLVSLFVISYDLFRLKDEEDEAAIMSLFGRSDLSGRDIECLFSGIKIDGVREIMAQNLKLVKNLCINSVWRVLNGEKNERVRRAIAETMREELKTYIDSFWGRKITLN
jgi:hypothetical protein